MRERDFLMDFLADPSLPGLGQLTGAFLRTGGDVLALSSAYRLLTEPPARAAYGGQQLRYRVALYCRGERHPFAAFDRLRYRVNDIAFHPSLPVLAIATGSYDGGWIFDGELALWNWETGEHGLAIQQTPEVVRVTFGPGGDSIVAYVRPWDDGVVQKLRGTDPFDLYYELRTPFLPALTPGMESAEAVARQMERRSPVSGATVKADSRFRQTATDAAAAIRSHIGLSELHARSPVWDLACLPGDRLGIVHDDCHLQVLAPDGTIASSFTGEGHGCEVYGGANLIVHVTRGDRRSGFEFSSTLLSLDDARLRVQASFPGAHTFSRAAD